MNIMRSTNGYYNPNDHIQPSSQMKSLVVSKNNDLPSWLEHDHVNHKVTETTTKPTTNRNRFYNKMMQNTERLQSDANRECPTSSIATTTSKKNHKTKLEPATDAPPTRRSLSGMFAKTKTPSSPSLTKTPSSLSLLGGRRRFSSSSSNNNRSLSKIIPLGSTHNDDHFNNDNTNTTVEDSSDPFASFYFEQNNQQKQQVMEHRQDLQTAPKVNYSNERRTSTSMDYETESSSSFNNNKMDTMVIDPVMISTVPLRGINCTSGIVSEKIVNSSKPTKPITLGKVVLHEFKNMSGYSNTLKSFKSDHNRNHVMIAYVIRDPGCHRCRHYGVQLTELIQQETNVGCIGILKDTHVSNRLTYHDKILQMYDESFRYPYYKDLLSTKVHNSRRNRSLSSSTNGSLGGTSSSVYHVLGEHQNISSSIEEALGGILVFDKDGMLRYTHHEVYGQEKLDINTIRQAIYHARQPRPTTPIVIDNDTTTSFFFNGLL